MKDQTSSNITSDQNEFSSFSVDSLVDNSITDFDLFLPVKEHFVLYSSSGYRWLKEELDALIKGGYQHFAIRRKDLPRAKIYQKISTLPSISEGLAPHERIASIEQVGTTFVKCLYEGEITDACVEKGKSIATSIVHCIAEDNSCIQRLGQLADHDYYTYHHSVRVASYAIAICTELGINNTKQLCEIALGGIFHDIGKKDVPAEVIHKQGALNEEEWKHMRSHPEKGHLAVQNTVLSHVSKEIILHHHEKMDGSGYPHNHDRSTLLPEVQIATVADVFDALTSNRAYQVKRTHFDALEFMKSKMIGTKLPLDPFKALISCLAKQAKNN